MTLTKIYHNKEENEYYAVKDFTPYMRDTFIENFDGVLDYNPNTIINKIIDDYLPVLSYDDMIDLYTSLAKNNPVKKNLINNNLFADKRDLAELYILEEVLDSEEDIENFQNDPNTLIDTVIKENSYSFIGYMYNYARYDFRHLFKIFSNKMILEDKKFNILDYVLNFLKEHISNFYYTQVIDKYNNVVYYAFGTSYDGDSDYYDMLFNTPYLDNLLNEDGIVIGISNDEYGDYIIELRAFFGDLEDDILYIPKKLKVEPHSINDYMKKHYNADFVEELI